jgi:vacuolar protein sorting-associated protein 45
MVQQAMSRGGVSQDMVNLVPAILRYAGVKSRGPGLYREHQHLMTKMTKSFITTVQGIQNVMDTIQSILRGKLNGRQYPSLVPRVSAANNNNNFSSSSRKTSNAPSQDPSTLIPDEILIYMVGGITYEEGTKIAEFKLQHAKSMVAGGGGGGISGGRSSSSSTIRVVLAGSTVHNSTSFLDELKATTVSTPSSSP